MPIDDALGNIEFSKEMKEEKQAERTRIIEPPNLLPAEKIGDLHDRFLKARAFLEDDRRYKIDTSDLKVVLDSFWPYATFYLRLRGGLDSINSELDRWNKYFEGVLTPELTGDRSAAGVKIPDALSKELLGIIEDPLAKINEEAKTLPSNAPSNQQLLTRVKIANETLVELYNTTDLLGVILLERALVSNFELINKNLGAGSFVAKQVIQRLYQLERYAIGKTRIKYHIYYHGPKGLKDISPGRFRNKLFKFFRE
ncbi:hypothetical protein HYT56_04260 [Candidatus Woesearchaeota archaeon]|nr:hypothetical protein [Candidatus Woesearchaeota archaeon]